MRLGVNARRLAGQRLGVARYIEHLAKDWAQMLEPDEESILFLREPLDPDDLPERHERRVLRSRFDGILWENLVLGRAARSEGLDVLFCPGYTAPATYRERTVVAIHSANEAEAGADPWWYRFTYTPIYKSSARRAARVILPSHSTLEDIRALYRIPEEKLVVVHLGADEAFRPIDQEEKLRDVRREYVGGDRPFAVFVGKLSQRRNIPLLIEAFAEAKRRTGMPHALLLFGPNHLHLPLERLAFEHGVADSVVQVDGEVPSHDRLALVYNAADLFVSASAYEGFSLPLVEALACGTPSVVTNRGALGEIADGAALLVDELSTSALADAIERGVSDESLRSELRTRGPERAQAFTSREAARRTLDVLREVAA